MWAIANPALPATSTIRVTTGAPLAITQPNSGTGYLAPIAKIDFQANYQQPGVQRPRLTVRYFTPDQLVGNTLINVGDMTGVTHIFIGSTVYKLAADSNSPQIGDFVVSG